MARRVGVPLLAATIVLFPSSSDAVQLSDAEVRAAIALGEGGRAKRITISCVASPARGEVMTADRVGGVQRDGRYHVIVGTAAGAIAARAAAAKDVSKTMTVEAVTDDMRLPGLYVRVDPDEPRLIGSAQRVSIPAVIQTVLFQTHFPAELVVWPDLVDTEPIELSDRSGGTVPGNRAVARFSVAALREVRGDLALVVVTREGERSCQILQKALAKLTH